MTRDILSRNTGDDCPQLVPAGPNCWSLGIGNELSSFADAALPLGASSRLSDYWVKGEDQGVIDQGFVPGQVMEKLFC